MSDQYSTANESSALDAIARKLFWWEPSESSRNNPKRLACQVMALGAWNDVVIARRVLGDTLFRDALREAPPGVFDPRSWNYWHLVFGNTPVPPLPVRTFP